MVEQISAQMIIEAITRGFQNVKSEIQGIGSSAQQAEQGIAETGQAATASEGQIAAMGSSGSASMALLITAANQAIQIFHELTRIAEQGYQTLKEGAELELVITRFERLSEELGTTGDAILNDLIPAMGYMVSEAEAMTLATDLMSLGLVNSQEQLVRMATVVGELGMDINELVLALSNQTTRRFDQLGVAVEGFDEKLQALEDQGYSTQEAFTEAFLQQAEEQIERVGSKAETTAGQLMQIEAAFKDIQTAGKLLFVDILGPAIDTLSDMAVAYQVLSEAVDRGEMSHAKMLLMVDSVRLGYIDLEDIIEQYGDTTGSATDTTFDYESALYSVSEAMATGAGMAELMTDEVYELTDAMIESLNAVQDATEGGMELWSESITASSAAIQANINRTMEFNEQLEQQRQAIDDAFTSMTRYTGMFDEGIWNVSDDVEEQAVEFFMNLADESENSMEEMEQWIDVVAGIDPALGEAMENSAAFDQFLKSLEQGVREGTITTEQAVDAVLHLGDAYTVMGDAVDVANGIIWDMELTTKQATEAQNAFKAAIDQGVVPIKALEDALVGAGAEAEQVQQALGAMLEQMAEGTEFEEQIDEILDALGLLPDEVSIQVDLETPDPVTDEELAEMIPEDQALALQADLIESDQIVSEAEAAAEEVSAAFNPEGGLVDWNEALNADEVSSQVENIPEVVIEVDNEAISVTLGELEGLQSELDNLDGTTINIEIHTEYTESGTPPTTTTTTTTTEGDGGQSGTQGWKTVPPGFPNDSYLVRMTSGEQYGIIPEGAPRVGFGGGGGVNKIVTINQRNYLQMQGNEATASGFLYIESQIIDDLKGRL